MIQFPFLSLRQSLILLRVSLAVIFLAHALVRLFTKDSIASFTGFLDGKGFPAAGAIVWGITVFEIGGGILLALGFFTKWICAGLILVLLAGVAIIHIQLGWFVGEHGTGGCEYSFILVVALVVTAAGDQRHYTVNQ